jgi:ribonucleoside-diphosphate reductase alpha chain
MLIKKRDGSFEECDKSKIRACVQRACDDATLFEVNVDAIVEEAWSQLYDGMDTSEIDKATIMAARSRIIREPEYAYAAAGLLLNVIYKEVFGHSVGSASFLNDYRNSFVQNMNEMIAAGRISPVLAEKFDWRELANAMTPVNDLKFKYLGLQTLYDRYFVKIEERRMETPQAFWMRVAMGLCINEPNPNQAAIAAYRMFSEFLYSPGTPTLFNSGTCTPQLSSCYLSTVEDSLDGIFGSIHNQARLSKYAGGLGCDWTPVRGMNAWIKGTNGPSQGTVPWFKVYNDMLVAVNQGSKRKGAGCAYMETWHIDILDFLDLRKGTGDDRRRCHDMNTANWIPDLFMQQVEADGDWYLFSPNEVTDLHELFGVQFEERYWHYVNEGEAGRLKSFVKMKAKDLWKKMLIALYETGHPWITFKDPSNIRYSNQHVGTVHSSNLCTEILLHTKPTLYHSDDTKTIGETAVCNLGSINLSAHVLHYESGEVGLDYKKLKSTIQQAMRLLDNVIDINFYPTQESRNSNMLNRPVGLGLMGWTDYLHERGIAFDSIEAAFEAGHVQELISYWAIDTSIELAKERGTYPTYQGSLWSQGKLPCDTFNDVRASRNEGPVTIESSLHWDVIRQKLAIYGIRNSNTMAIAPTATISFILGCSQSIEPDFGVLYVYSTLSGEFTMLNDHFVRKMKELGLWNEQLIQDVVRADGDVANLDIPDSVKNEFKTAFNIRQEAIIDAAAQRQVWIDQGQSVNLYTNNDSLRFLSNIYFHAWKSGLKTTYYLRSKSASKIEKSTVSASAEPQPMSMEQRLAFFPRLEQSACSINAARNGEICESCQ